MSRGGRKGDARRVYAVLTSEWTYGLDLMRAAGLRPGRFYPAVWTLEQAGDVDSMFEDGPRPQRRMYRLPAVVS